MRLTPQPSAVCQCIESLAELFASDGLSWHGKEIEVLALSGSTFANVKLPRDASASRLKWQTLETSNWCSEPMTT